MFFSITHIQFPLFPMALTIGLKLSKFFLTPALNTSGRLQITLTSILSMVKFFLQITIDAQSDKRFPGEHEFNQW